MKIRLLLATLLCALCVAPAIRAEDAKEPETPLQVQMNKMNDAVKKLRGAVSDATKNEASLAAVKDIKAAALEANKMEPEKKKKTIPAAEQEKFVADYHTKMKEFIGEVEKLEAALKAGNNTDAAAIFAKIGDLQKADHKEFKAIPKKN